MASSDAARIDVAPSEALPADAEPRIDGPTADAGSKAPAMVTDYISGKAVRATPEEVEAVQVFARRLVDELGYPKTHIQTRPQFRVRTTPSATKTKTKS